MKGAMARYRFMAYCVGVGLMALVFIGMPIQYIGHNKDVVAIIGPIHGFLYIVYLLAVLDLARRAGFSLLQLLGAIAGGFLPGLAFYVEHRVRLRVERQHPEIFAVGADH